MLPPSLSLFLSEFSIETFFFFYSVVHLPLFLDFRQIISSHYWCVCWCKRMTNQENQYRAVGGEEKVKGEQWEVRRYLCTCRGSRFYTAKPSPVHVSDISWLQHTAPYHIFSTCPQKAEKNPQQHLMPTWLLLKLNSPSWGCWTCATLCCKKLTPIYLTNQ